MSERFIKFIPSSEAKWLRQHFPNAFLLLSYIAENARRTKDNLDGLEIGDAIIGNYKESGLSRKQYRNAKDKLIELGIIEVVWNAKIKNLQKRAMKRAIKNEVVCLLKSTIWDINIIEEGHDLGLGGAMKGPSNPSTENPHSSPFPSSFPPSPRTPSPYPISFPPSFPPKNEKNIFAQTAALPRKKETPKDFYFSFEEKKFIGISEIDFQSWDVAYEGVNILQELAKAEQWVLANPKKQKKNWRKFLTNWLSGACEKSIFRKARIDQDKDIANEKVWETKNRESFFRWKKENGEIIKHMEYSNGYVINSKNGKELSVKMNADAFYTLFPKIAGVKTSED